MQFDILTATKQGYKTVWDERAYLVKLALIPVIIKIICFFVAYSLEVYQGTFSYPLFMLPAYFAEGWLIAQFLRTTLTGERWPVRVKGSVEEHFDWLVMRARSILACILTYVLIAMAHGGALVFLVKFRELAEEQEAALAGDGNPMLVFGALALIGLLLWGFRLLWLHVPMILLVPVRNYLKFLGGMMSSFHMLAVWMLSIIPVFFLMMFITSLALGPTGGALADAPPFLSFLFIGLNLVAETVTAVIASVAMAALIKPLLILYGAKPLFPNDGQDSKRK
ncbi:MAG: hypothetical protein CMH28_05820 [Micavibrio sp.]|nr:hypothetical protein [Micavibrio sp.]|tara:strand:+ start:538 stop:1377 length:840 start_codon:yes stop_codon:yes gene_type:complete